MSRRRSTITSAETPNQRKKTLGSLFEAILPVPASASKKLKKNETLLTVQAVSRTLKSKSCTTQKTIAIWGDAGSPKGTESIDNYEMLRKTFLGNYSQQKKYIKVPVEIHHIKQREGESLEAFMKRFKVERDDNGQETLIVIEAEVEGHLIHRMYVDGGSASEVPVAIQRHHRPHEPQENTSGLIYRSRNAKIPDGKRNNNDPQHYHNGSEVHDGDRSTKYLFNQRTSGRRRNQNSNSPRKPTDMTSVRCSIGKNRLNVREGCPPIRQKRRGHAPDRNKAIQEKVSKHVQTKITREVPWSENKKEDALSKIASTSFAHLTKQVLVETFKRKSIEEREIIAIVQEEEEEYCWMTPLVEYLTEDILSAKTKKARAIKIKARQYTMINGVLYRKSFLEPWLRCVGPMQAVYVVKEIHEGSCSMHSGPRFVVAKAIRSGYYWPTMHKDARNIIKACSDSQTYKPVPRNPQQKLTPITSPWPFYK
nr:reverse transcriptase domain-containing protein [Tanacetum cinerariifolium]